MKAIPLLVAAALVAGMLAGCAQDASELEEKAGITYYKGTKRQFHGKAVTYYKDSQGKNTDKVFEEGNYEYGRKEGMWITHRWDGERDEVEYRAGKRHGRLVTYYDNGRKKHQQEYRNDRPDGEGSYYSTDGEMVSTAFYKDGISMPHLSPGYASNANKDLNERWVKSMKGAFKRSGGGNETEEEKAK